MMDRYQIPKTYAVWSKDKDIRFKSTSGGTFSCLALSVIDKKGKVAGASYNKDNMVEHVLVEDYAGIADLRQSKYLSSHMSNIYEQVKAELSKGTLVGFCGAPCQVAGLYKFLNKDYDNLITMDFICLGMNSPKAYKSWLNEVEKEYNSEVKRIWFKYKEGGWKTSPRRTRIDFKDGSYIVQEGKNNLYMSAYLESNLFIRPCCGNCQFKGVPRPADITLADFWGIDKKYDDDKGTSMVLINSEKGQQLFNDAKDKLCYHERDFNEIFEGNPRFAVSVVVPEEGHEFLKDLDNLSFSECLKKYKAYPKEDSLSVKVLRKIKSIAQKMIK